MTETKHDTDLAGSTERLLEALRHAATDLGGSDALSELGDRARGIVADLAKSARRGVDTMRPAQRAAQPSRPDAAAPDADAAMAGRSEDLPRRILELRACVGEVADVLEATVERLETIEAQLGDADLSVEQTLRDSIERCERVLMGIEHRVGAEVRLAGAGEGTDQRDETPRASGCIDGGASAAQRGDRMPTVLVVAEHSRRRAELCIALEKQGLRTLAATNLKVALDVAARRKPDGALVVLDGPRESSAFLLEEWKDCEDSGRLPAAAILDAGDEYRTGESVSTQGDGVSTQGDGVSTRGDRVSTRGWMSVKQEHGAAAMAAQLKTLMRQTGESGS
ncbi:MAG TPA: hypothetical protein VN634_13765 [Candidatus Limnocylindrales bacterium]|nr:hypothetical protein [Candidatus Limnocylindrales bacterium]